MTWNAAVFVAVVPIAMGLVMIVAERALWRRRAGLCLVLAGAAILCVAQARDRNDPAGLILPWLLAAVWAIVAALSRGDEYGEQDADTMTTKDRDAS